MRIALHLLALTLLALTLPAFAHAKCASGSMRYWPPADQPIATTGLMYVEGFGHEQAIVKGLKRAALRGGGQTIPLEAITTNVGAMRLTQTVYRASKPLTAGTRYTLVLTGATKTWTPTRWTEDDRQRVSWVAAEAPSARWTAAPTAGAASYRRLGCGPAVRQLVTLPMAGRGGLVEVVVKGGASEQRYVLPVPAEGDLGIGHGMCSGAFDVSGAKATALVATLAVLSADGTRAPAPGAVTFSAVQP